MYKSGDRTVRKFAIVKAPDSNALSVLLHTPCRDKTVTYVTYSVM